MKLAKNRLIEGLPREARSRLLARCEPVQMRVREFDDNRDAGLHHVYFPTGSVFSLSSRPEEGPGFEFSMVGDEGMLGAHMALGVATPAALAHVQAEGGVANAGPAL